MFAVFAAAMITLAGQSKVEVESLKFDVAALRTAEKVEIKVTEGNEQVVYKGVPLRTILASKLKTPNTMASLRSMSDAVLVVRAPDDYQAAVSAVAVAMDTKGEKFFLALERNGKPLDDKQGPVKLIVPGDPEHIRWVRMVSAVDLVHLTPEKKAR